MSMDPVTPVRNLIEEPTVETGILALPNLDFSEVGHSTLVVPSWAVLVVLLLVLGLTTWMFYRAWPWSRKSMTDLDLIRAVDASQSLLPRIPKLPR